MGIELTGTTAAALAVSHTTATPCAVAEIAVATGTSCRSNTAAMTLSSTACRSSESLAPVTWKCEHEETGGRAGPRKLPIKAFTASARQLSLVGAHASIRRSPACTGRRVFATFGGFISAPSHGEMVPRQVATSSSTAGEAARLQLAFALNMSTLEVKREELLTREEAASRLSTLAAALAAGEKVHVPLGGSNVKMDVPDHVRCEIELEVDGDEIEMEVELKWPAPVHSPVHGD